MKYMFIILVNIFIFNSTICQSNEVVKISNKNFFLFPNSKIKVDTTGLNFIVSAGSPWMLYKTEDKIVLAGENKKLGVKDYETFIKKGFEKFIKSEEPVTISNLQGFILKLSQKLDDNEMITYIGYVGDEDNVYELKCLYPAEFDAKYNDIIYNCLKNAVIDRDVIQSPYEGYPFIAETDKFGYQYQGAYMPNSLTLSKSSPDSTGTITFFIMENTTDNQNESYYDPNEGWKMEEFIYPDRKVKIYTDSISEPARFDAMVIYDLRILYLSSVNDYTDHFKNEIAEIAKSLKLK